MMKKPKSYERGSGRDGKNEVHKRSQENRLRERQQSAGKSASPEETEGSDVADTAIATRPATRKVSTGTLGKRIHKGPTITVIFALDRNIARECAERNGLKSSEWSFLTGPDILVAAMNVNIVVWRVGDYYTSKSLYAVEALIDKLGIEYVDAPL